MKNQKLTITTNAETPEELEKRTQAITGFLSEYKGVYDGALRRANAAAETLNTEFWQTRYRSGRETLTNVKANLIARVEDLATRIRAHGPTDDLVTDMKDLAKAIESAAEDKVQWERVYVHPFTRYEQDVINAIEKPKGHAKSKAAEAPLTFPAEVLNGILAIVATWPTAKWDAETGKLEIIPQST